MPLKAKRSAKKKLPDEIIIIPNPDKDDSHETWYPGRNFADIPHPVRWVFSAKPHSGKSNLILNIIMRVSEGKAPYERIVLCHGSGTHTQEYNSLALHDVFDTLPPANYFMDLQKKENKKSLVIIDDLELGDLKKRQLADLSSLFRFVSTHHNWSIFIAYQSFFDISTIVRKCSSVFTIWAPRSKNEIAMTANRLQVDQTDLEEIFDTVFKTRYDSVTFDFTLNSPCPVRLNLFTPIDMKLN